MQSNAMTAIFTIFLSCMAIRSLLPIIRQESDWRWRCGFWVGVATLCTAAFLQIPILVS